VIALARKAKDPRGVAGRPAEPVQAAGQRPIVVAELPKNRRETLRVALDRYGGMDLIDIRVCVELTAACHVQTPTKKGVSLNIAQLPALRQALADAEARARELGLLPG
jgi:hypothetical protein